MWGKGLARAGPATVAVREGLEVFVTYIRLDSSLELVSSTFMWYYLNYDGKQQPGQKAYAHHLFNVRDSSWEVSGSSAP
jgi:hypothetical protein